MKKLCYVVTLATTIESFFIPQLQYLSDHGFEIHVICSKDDKLQDLLGEKIKYIPLDMPRGISIAGTIKSIVELIKIFNQEKYDMVQYSTPNAGFNTAVASKICKIKVRNYHLMGLRYEGDQGIKRKILKTMEKISCHLSTHIECVSNSNRNTAIKEKLFPSKKAVVVWKGSTGGVDLKKFDIFKKEEWRHILRNKYEIEDNNVIFGFVGRITKDKGINELIGAFKDLLAYESNSILMLIGSFEGEEELEQEKLEWAKKSKNVIFISSVSDIERYYAVLDVLVLPSYREGFGNVVIEAEAMGIPVIVSNIPGPIDAMQDGVTGLKCQLKNREDLCEKMKLLLDENTRKMYSLKARKFVEESFDSEVLCEKIYQRKRELLSE